MFYVIESTYVNDELYCQQVLEDRCGYARHELDLARDRIRDILNDASALIAVDHEYVSYEGQDSNLDDIREAVSIVQR